MKKFFAAIIFAVVFAANSLVQAAGELKVLADSAILVEASTGRILYEKNAETERPPASMTKMLTCIVALENLKPTDTIRISRDVAFTEDVALTWGENDTLSAWDVMTALMVVSENGGAVALAQEVGGSVPQFAKMMNDKATEIGCTHSHFVNPNGLPATNHYSTASDMARIASYCMKNENFRKLVATNHTSIRWISPKEKFAELNNTNQLLSTYKGATGIKTGWTVAAAGCLAASAKRGDIELIAVIMHSPDGNTRFVDATELLNYGFERVRMVNGIDKEQVEKTVFVRGGKRATLNVGVKENLNFPLMANEDPKLLKVTYDVPRVVDAGKGIHEGDVLGEAILRYDGKPVARMPLVAKRDVDSGFSIGSLFVSIAASLIG